MAKYKSENKKHIVYQRVLAVVALAGLFACGLMVGFAFNGAKKISSKISQIKTAVENTLPDKTCAAVEKVLEAKLWEETEKSTCDDFIGNVRIYEELIVKGCPENQNKYVELKDRSFSLANATCNKYELNNYGFVVDDTELTCEKIRDEILQRINSRAFDDYEHINNAKKYAIIAERGCANEAEHYKDLAKQELALARAVTDDNFADYQAIDVIETYKRLQMQAAAEEVFEKMKKLTNPAIDFILQVEKIIKE